MKVCHIINSFNNGGAENILLKICEASKDKKNITQHYVISLISNGDLFNQFNNTSAKVYELNFKKNFFFLSEVFKLFKIVKQIQPNILMGWMYHSSLLVYLIGKLLKIKEIYWNIRHTKLVFLKSSIITICISKFMAIFSNISKINIIYCSYESEKLHKRAGYNNKYANIIFNGVDVHKYKISKEINLKLRNKYQIEQNTLVIGMIANFRRQKNHKFLINSLGIFKEKKINFKLVLAGRDISYNNKKLLKIINKNNIKENVLLLNNVNNTNTLYSLFDVFVLASNFGESFSNVLIESMSSSVPCISTNVGASKFIIGNNGWILDNYNEKEFSNKLEQIYKLTKKIDYWNNLKELNRKRIIDNFSLEKMINNYNSLWK